MIDLNILNTVKTKVSDRRKINSESTYENGMKLLDLFLENQDLKTLKKAGEIFSEAIEFNKEDPKSYIGLGYIFYVLENNEFALKYFNDAEKLTKLPDEILEIKTSIEKSLNYYSPPEEDDFKKSLITLGKPDGIKVKVPAKSNFWKLFTGK